MPAPRTAATLALALVGLSACASQPQQAPATSPPSAASTSTADAPSATQSAPSVPVSTPTATATYPATPIGAAMHWFFGQMSTGTVEADPSARFTEDFRRQMQVEHLVLFGELRPLGPWTTEAVYTDGNDGVATLVNGRGERFTLSMQVNDEGLISGVRFARAGTETEAPGATASSSPSGK